MAITEQEISDVIKRQWPTALSSGPSSESLFLLMQERDRQYNQRMEAQEKSFLLTLANLKDRFAQQDNATAVAFAAADKAVQAALGASKEAVAKAEMAADKRFESVNEFRNTLKDQQALFPQRVEVDAIFKALDAKIAAAIMNLGNRIEAVVAVQNRTTGNAEGINALWGYIVGAVGLGLAVLSLVYRLQK